MALSKGKKILFGVLGVVAVGGIAAGIYVWHFGKKNKPQYGKKHQATKSDLTLLTKFSSRLSECKNEVFTHEKFPYLPPKGAAEKGYLQAIKVMLRVAKGCIEGQPSADGKGFSVQLDSKQLLPIVETKDCKVFATKLVAIKGCSSMFDDLPEPIIPEEKDAPPGAGFLEKSAKPKDVTDAKPKVGADAKPKEGADAKPKEGADAKPKEGADAKPKEGADAKPKEGAAAIKPVSAMKAAPAVLPAKPMKEAMK